MTEIGIYKIENKINNKVYIGQSINIQKRWSDHKSRYLDPNDHSYNTHLYKSMRKYGIENFDFSIVELCLAEELNEKERYWIGYYNSFFNGYNLTFGGDAAGREASKEKIIGIIFDLENTTDTQKTIAKKWSISEEMVQGINTGRYWKHDRKYPIREQYRRPKVFCIDCGKEIRFGSTRCVECEQKRRTQEISPEEREILKKQIREMSFVAVGLIYGISDNAVRKRCAKCGLPIKKREIQKYTDEEWALI